MLSIKNYNLITNILFIALFVLKGLNILIDRIEISLFVFWSLPLIIFYFYLLRLRVKAYQWFCFVLLIYFLFASVRVFGTTPFWIDIFEFICVCLLFIHIMYGPKTINKLN